MLSLVTVSYFHSLDLRKNIPNWIEFLGTDVEILIIDNSKGRDTDLYSISGPVRVIKSENLGFGAGNNIGISESSFDSVILVNPDVRFLDGITQAVNYVLTNKNKVIGFRDTSRNEGLYYNIKPKNFIKSFFHIRIGKFDARNHFFSGALIAFPKSTPLRFDENIFLYFEETDLLLNAISKGIEVSMYDGRAVYEHIKDRQSFSPLLKRHEYESGIYVLRKWNISIIISLLLVCISLLVKGLLEAFFLNANKLKELKILINVWVCRRN